MGTDFSFDFRRTSPLGAAEAAPADADALIVWDLPDSKTIPTHELPDSLLVLATGATIAYELAIWDATSSPAAWFVIGTGTLVGGVPTVIPFAYRGARIYLRRTNVTLADVVISVSHRQLGAAMSGLVLPATAATSALQTAGNASLTSIDGKVATATKQDTGNTTLANIKTILDTDTALAEVFASAVVAADYSSVTASVDVTGKRRITFVVNTTKNGAAAANQVQYRLRWDYGATQTNSHEPLHDLSAPTVAQPYATASAYILQENLPQATAGVTSNSMSLTFNVPSGATACRMALAEILDVVNRATVRVFASTSQVM